MFYSKSHLGLGDPLYKLIPSSDFSFSWEYDFSPSPVDLKSCCEHWLLSLFYKDLSSDRIENEVEGDDGVWNYTGAVGNGWWEITEKTDHLAVHLVRES